MLLEKHNQTKLPGPLTRHEHVKNTKTLWVKDTIFQKNVVYVSVSMVVVFLKRCIL